MTVTEIWVHDNSMLSQPYTPYIWGLLRVGVTPTKLLDFWDLQTSMNDVTGINTYNT